MIPAFIQCVPERLPEVYRSIAPALRDQGATVFLVCDKYREGARETHERAMIALRNALISSGDEWGLVVQDDVTIAPQALECVAVAMHRSQADVLHLFVPPSKRFEEMYANGVALATGRRIWLQAAAYRHSFLERVAVRSADLAELEGKSADVWVDGLTAAFDARVVTMLPGVVEHRLDLRSVMGHPPKVGKNERRSRIYDPDVAPQWYAQGGFHDA